MTIRLLAFGITKDIIGHNELELEVATHWTIGDLRQHLEQEYTKLANLSSLAIALNEVYAEDSFSLQSDDIVALIPPVSGG